MQVSKLCSAATGDDDDDLLEAGLGLPTAATVAGDGDGQQHYPRNHSQGNEQGAVRHYNTQQTNGNHLEASKLQQTNTQVLSPVRLTHTHCTWSHNKLKFIHRKDANKDIHQVHLQI